MNDEGDKLSDSPDRISDLPGSVIECILSRLPLRDVVRTSILSTNWRHHWTKEFGKHDVPERLLAPLGDLGNLTVLEMNICTPDNLLSAFCILKSSLHLHKLNILVESKLARSWRDAVDYLEAQQRAEKMYLFGHHYITPDDDSKMLAIATRLRASTKAEIIYSRSSAYDSPFNFWRKQIWM